MNSVFGIRVYIPRFCVANWVYILLSAGLLIKLALSPCIYTYIYTESPGVTGLGQGAAVRQVNFFLDFL